eukprot:gene25482-30765_t
MGGEKGTNAVSPGPGATKKHRNRPANTFDIYCLGLTIVIGGQTTSWNLGLAGGFWQYFIAVFLVSTGYVCLCMCIAEMTSFLAFAGGSYGYVRCALGPFTGYMVGFCESVEYIMYVAASVAVFGDVIPMMTGASHELAPIYWLIFYVIGFLTIVPGGQLFWQFSNYQAMLCLLLILMYCFGGMSEVNFEKYDSYFIGGGKSFMEYYPIAAWFYVGVEAMTLSCEDIADAGKKVPKAIMACVGTLFVTCQLVYFVSSSLAPGSIALAAEIFPFDPAFIDIFHVNKMGAAYLALPQIFSTSFGFMFAFGRQLYSMSKSGLFPVIMSKTYGTYETPYMGLLIGSIISFSALLVLFYTVPLFGAKIFNICMLGSCSVYIALARAYIVCYDRYSNLERHYKSPLGKWAAYYVIAVYSLMMVGLAFYQKDDYLAITAFIILSVLAVIYYFTVAQKREFFSEEEQEKFMKAYILNANHKRKNKTSALGFLNKILPGTSHTTKHKSRSQLNAVSQRSVSKNHSSVEHLEQVNRRAGVHRTASMDGTHFTPKPGKEAGSKADDNASRESREGLTNAATRDGAFSVEDADSRVDEVRGASAVTQHF